MMNLSKFGNRFVRQLLTKQATYQQKLQSFSFFVGPLRIYHLFRGQSKRGCRKDNDYD